MRKFEDDESKFEHVRGNCDCCTTTKSPKPSTVTETSADLTTIPGFRIHLDTVGPLPRSNSGMRWCIVGTDEATGRMFVHPCKKKTPENSRRLMQTVVRHYTALGYEKPGFVQTDRGSEFKAKAFLRWLDELDMEWRPSAPYQAPLGPWLATTSPVYS